MSHKPSTRPVLANLATLLSTWVEGERAETCRAWAAYRNGEGQRPGIINI